MVFLYGFIWCCGVYVWCFSGSDRFQPCVVAILKRRFAKKFESWRRADWAWRSFWNGPGKHLGRTSTRRGQGKWMMKRHGFCYWRYFAKKSFDALELWICLHKFGYKNKLQGTYMIYDDIWLRLDLSLKLVEVVTMSTPCLEKSEMTKSGQATLLHCRPNCMASQGRNPCEVWRRSLGYKIKIEGCHRSTIKVMRIVRWDIERYSVDTNLELICIFAHVRLYRSQRLHVQSCDWSSWSAHLYGPGTRCSSLHSHRPSQHELWRSGLL